MFTGIIADVGTVKEKTPDGPATRFRFQSTLIAQDLKVGDSVACNGACLTAEQVFADGFIAAAVPETLARTTLGQIRIGDSINLEAATKAGHPLGGHIVQGHVDGVCEVTGMRELPGGGGMEFSVRIPSEYSRYCVEKGSFCLHGISLTLAAVSGDELRFAIVPHTLSHTNLAKQRIGSRMNFEVDIVGKYVEKLLGYLALPETSKVPSQVSGSAVASALGGHVGTGSSARAQGGTMGLTAEKLGALGYGV